ncbi:hypothetical protein GGI25_005326 [Coemansia spiralis]|uniref:Uncharacterized protein n=2 Tax=Coemansia TaxID=4863 RepID=A0A9W8G4P9_9FUNG|nr:ankyrin repeat-containing domain protein [Coemansia spiralis]KAJ2671827.1 hypothetical protein GGI25_005326 [Coemansia spiralis]
MAEKNKGFLSYHVLPPSRVSTPPDNTLLDASNHNHHHYHIPLAFPAPPTTDLGLHSAVSRGDIGSICYALLGGQPMNSLQQGLQAIHLAAIHGDAAIVELLLQNGADANAQSASLACRTLQHQVTDKLAEKKGTAKQQRSAKSRGSFSFLRDTSLDSSIISSPIGVMFGLHSMQAANSASCDLLLDASDDISLACASGGNTMDDYFDATPLHFAVANGHVACAEVLLQCGARMDIADSYGNTPETLVAACGCAAIADAFYQFSQASIFENELLANVTAETEAEVEAEMVSKVLDTDPFLQLPSPDPSVLCFSDASPTIPSTALLYAYSPLPANDLFAQCRISRSATSPLPSHNVSGQSATAENHQGGSRVIPMRRHTASEAEGYLSSKMQQPSPSLTTDNWNMAKHRNSSPIGLRTRFTNKSQLFTHNAKRLLPGCNKNDFIGSRRSQNSDLKKQNVPPSHIITIPERQCFDTIATAASRSSSTASRRERSYTDSVIERAWRKYLEFDDEYARDNAQSIAAGKDGTGGTGGTDDSCRPLPELWMWRQAAIAVRNRRSQSLSANQH